MKYVFLSILLMTAMAQASVTRQGEFRRVDDRHLIQGHATVEQSAEDTRLTFAPDFKVTNGPDLRVVLADSRGEHPMIIVAPLQATAGAQEYRLAIDEETLADYDQVIVYCAKFHVNFGAADLH